MSPAEIQERKQEIVEDSNLYAQAEAVPGMQVQGYSDKDNILAYNFDIVDGTPIEWTGIYKESRVVGTESQESGVVGTESQRDNSPEQTLHRAAGEHAEDVGNGTETQSLSTNEVQTSQDEKIWGDWDKQAESDSLITTDDGNDLSWESKWKQDPNDLGNQGLNTELTLRPYNTGLYPWLTNKAIIDVDFNGSTYDEISDYGPPNSIGSNTQSISLGLSSDEVVNVGVSSSTTSSNLDIDNKSDDDEDYVKIHFDISGDLRENTVRLNQSAVTTGTEDSSDTTYCNQDLEATFETLASHDGMPLEKESPSQNIRMYWS
ncbi:hypothetical protein [Natrinema sp. SYSU A 869]|uniref:hypothetical protein n=1 Tax=Natrinema sp. SYSU A 869 TaxID=2871694 RepID=UPI001CA39930|nr:hypothetical protein [Natrinema sp. SYSU A 869]